jgi:hypothetical protein
MANLQLICQYIMLILHLEGLGEESKERVIRACLAGLRR